MTLDQAVASLSAKLGEPDVFSVSHNGSEIVVRVNFVYRAKEVPDQWEGFRVTRGRVSCW